MMIASVVQEGALELPQALKTAQAAIHLPEVQEMLRKLSEYNLGVLMPHAHDENTGGFRPLPDDVMQVESGLAVSFRPSGEMASQPGRFLAVGWVWRAGAPAPVAACEMAEQQPGEIQRYGKHKM